MSKDRIKILVVDDHPIARHGLIQLISQEEDMFVCGEAEDASVALRMIENEKPDIAIVDISLGKSNGIDLVGSAKKRFPGMEFLIVSMHDESIYAERALRAGAKGYVMKQEAVEQIVRAIHVILNGDLFLSDSMRQQMLHMAVHGEVGKGAVALLSNREFEIFRLIGNGLGTSKIANYLNLSVKTIESHRAKIKEKLKLEAASDLVEYAIRWMRVDGR